MNGCKKIISIAISLQMIISLTAIGCKASMDNAYWEGSAMYTLLDEGEKSNCDVNFLITKVLYDYPAHRIHILFMMCLSRFNDANLSGVEMKFNNLGKVKLRADGNNEYDNKVYYAELDHIEDSVSKTLYLETIVGIKQGIPDNLNMSVIITDTNGVNSNTFDVDITPQKTEVLDNQKKTTKKRSSATKKTKKAVTSKKSKTKQSTTKTVKEKEENNLTGSAEFVQIVDPEVTTQKDDKKTIMVLIASLIVVTIACTCTIAIKKKH